VTTTTTTQLAALATASEIDITTPQRRHAPPSNHDLGRRPRRAAVIRSYNEPDGSWYRQARRTGRGQVTAGGHRYDLTFTTDRGKSSP